MRYYTSWLPVISGVQVFAALYSLVHPYHTDKMGVFWFLLSVICCFGALPLLSGATSCSCVSGCNVTLQNKDNVAVGKTVDTSSLAGSSNACYAVDGNTNGPYFESGSNDTTAWWHVDLGQVYTVNSLTIYYAVKRRMAGIRIYIDGNQCFKFPAAPPDGSGHYPGLDDVPNPIHIPCQSPLSGRNVTLAKDYAQTYIIFNIHEVQVWVCKNGYFGHNCTQCGQCKDDAPCDSAGECSAGCKRGYYPPQCVETCKNRTWGENCTDTCGHCANSAACNVLNGQCSNCGDGYALPMCTNCAPGYYGWNCSACGECAPNSTACSNTTGQCLAGCSRPGLKPQHCREACTGGTYGLNCSLQCGQCKDDHQCDVMVGNCPQGCKDGYYGQSCKEKCGMCKDSKKCESDGTCPDGCQIGYMPPFCNQNCANNTWGDNCSIPCGRCTSQCYFASGECQTCLLHFKLPKCTDCSSGWYGPDCDVGCLNCGNQGSCNRTTGHCDDGCRPGWIADANTDFCNQTCGDGKYGDRCAETCGYCQNGTPCVKQNGTCPSGCAEGYKGSLCIDEFVQENSPAPIIAGIVVAAVVLLAIAIVVVIVVRRRRRGKTPGLTSEAHPAARNGSQPANKLDSPLSFEPPGRNTVNTASTSQARAKTKPIVAVKPTVGAFENKGKGVPDSGHVYENFTPTQQSQARIEDTRNQTPHSSAQRTTKETSFTTAISSAYNNSSTLDHASESSQADLADPEQFEDEAVADQSHYYNDGDVYSTFKASRPQLDTVQKYLVDRLASDELPHRFQDLPRSREDASTGAGNMDINFKKNRFASILPYDDNRVVLRDGYDKDRSTDYVNASYVRGYNSERMYIAAQGPRDNTTGDFWRMVWQEKITHIVMLTNVKEMGKNKCYEYWPGEGKTVTHGPITITGLDVDSRANFDIRTFRIKMAGSQEERTVIHYHYVTWPDHGVPDTTPLVNFWHYVRTKTRQGPDAAPVPTLIHCSAGVGRSGTFIGLELAMDQVTREGKIDVEEVVNRLRQERCHMVQAVEQYVFLHKALLEAYTARDSIIPVDQFEQTFPQPITAHNANPRIEKEFQTLTQMRSLEPKQNYDTAKHDENYTKNRNPDLLPLENHMVYLTEFVRGRNQYINAVYLSTIRDMRGCILTQLPLLNTLVDFWRMVWGNYVTNIVSLASKDEQQQLKPYCWYWPRREDETIQTGVYTVKLVSSSQIGDRITAYDLSVQKEGLPTSRNLRLLRYEDWTGEMPANTSDLLHLVDALDNAGADGKGPRTIIQCSDGVSRSGLFSAVCAIIHRMTYDREVDVYMTVRNLQSVRPEAVTTAEQYRFCYQVVQHKIRDMSVYANT